MEEGLLTKMQNEKRFVSVFKDGVYVSALVTWLSIALFLQIVGMLITYFVLIVQFVPGNSESDDSISKDCCTLLANYTKQCNTGNA